MKLTNFENANDWKSEIDKIWMLVFNAFFVPESKMKWYTLALLYYSVYIPQHSYIPSQLWLKYFLQNFFSIFHSTAKLNSEVAHHRLFIKFFASISQFKHLVFKPTWPSYLTLTSIKKYNQLDSCAGLWTLTPSPPVLAASWSSTNCIKVTSANFRKGE